MNKPPNIKNNNLLSKSPVRRTIKSKVTNTKGQSPGKHLYSCRRKWSTDTDVSSSSTSDNPQTNTKNKKLVIPPLLSEANISSENNIVEDKKPHARIVDLCEDDRKRILQLIEELVKYKEEKLSLELTVTKLNEQLQDKKNEITELTERYTNKETEMLKEAECLQSTIKELSSKNEVLKQTHELEKQVLESRIRELVASAKSYKAEKEHIQTKMSHHSQKLRIAITTVDRLTNELKALRLNKDQIDKAAQVPEVKGEKCNSSSPEELEMPESNTLCDGRDRDSNLLSELFFMSSPFPWQLEPIFFMQPPTNIDEGAEVWEILP